MCHVYDKERYYVPFDDIAPDNESYPIKFLQKAMPDYAWYLDAAFGSFHLFVIQAAVRCKTRLFGMLKFITFFYGRYTTEILTSN